MKVLKSPKVFSSYNCKNIVLLSFRLDYQPLFGKMSPNLPGPEEAAEIENIIVWTKKGIKIAKIGPANIFGKPRAAWDFGE